MVELVSEEGVVVATGVVDDNIVCGMELHHVKLWPNEVAVHVLNVVDGTIWTREFIGEHLGQCMGLVIRWKKSKVCTNIEVRPSTSESGRRQNFRFSPRVTSKFEFPKNNSSPSPSELSFSIVGNCSTP